MAIPLVRSALLGAALCIGAGMPARAQCPDGTPPPCRAAPGPPAASRRPAPALDDRTWIVLPFENVARAAEIDWLRDASVNLLYLDMSRWQDIRVIDDERVADLIREVPEARGGAQLTLQSGLAVARRAGAGRLVMGDLLKLGPRTQVVGKVFDVRSGQRVRTVRHEAADPDAIIATFGNLARSVLDVEPPDGTALGAVGTTSIGAYRAYLAGIGYLNGWMLDSARTEFGRALALDSTFALAHYKLALVRGWEAPGSPDGQRHAELALRLGTGLPPRERALVTGYAAFAGNRFAEACTVFGRMVAADSTDVEAWYNLGECSYHDLAVMPVAGDSTRFAFRSSWNTALQAFRRALALDPTYHLAFQHIQDALMARLRVGCTIPAGQTGCPQNVTPFQAAIRRAGDSLVTEPVNGQGTGGSVELARQVEVARREGARQRNLELARQAAEAWLAAGPGEDRPRLAYARILLRMGQVRRADSVLGLLPERTKRLGAPGDLWMDRLEIALKLGRVVEGLRLADSIAAAAPVEARTLATIVGSVFGKVAPLGAMVDSNARFAPLPVRRYLALQTASVAGARPDSLLEAEADFLRSLVPAQGLGRALSVVAGTFLWTDPEARAGRWPATDTAHADPRIAFMSVVAIGDTARIRRAGVVFDSIAAGRRDDSDLGYALAGAHGHLAIGDTARALARLRFFRDVSWPISPVLEQIGPGFIFAGQLWPRTLLLLGDLAAATGARDEAVAAYRQVLGFWQAADPSFQPQIQRVREALGRLGG